MAFYLYTADGTNAMAKIITNLDLNSTLSRHRQLHIVFGQGLANSFEGLLLCVQVWIAIWPALEMQIASYS